jgi:hypothetical protein
LIPSTNFTYVTTLWAGRLLASFRISFLFLQDIRHILQW